MKMQFGAFKFSDTIFSPFECSIYVSRASKLCVFFVEIIKLVFLFLFFLDVPLGMWDPNSPTSDGTCVSCNGSMES